MAVVTLLAKIIAEVFNKYLNVKYKPSIRINFNLSAHNLLVNLFFEIPTTINNVFNIYLYIKQFV